MFQTQRLSFRLFLWSESPNTHCRMSCGSRRRNVGFQQGRILLPGINLPRTGLGGNVWNIRRVHQQIRRRHANQCCSTLSTNDILFFPTRWTAWGRRHTGGGPPLQSRGLHKCYAGTNFSWMILKWDDSRYKFCFLFLNEQLRLVRLCWSYETIRFLFWSCWRLELSRASVHLWPAGTICSPPPLQVELRPWSQHECHLDAGSQGNNIYLKALRAWGPGISFYQLGLWTRISIISRPWSQRKYHFDAGSWRGNIYFVQLGPQTSISIILRPWSLHRSI